MKIIEAVIANDADEVRRQVRRVKNLNRRQDNGYTLLGFAAKSNADRVIAPLIEAGALPTANESLHPLYLAASEGSDAALDALLEARQWEDAPLQGAVEAAALQGKVGSLRLLLEKAGASATPGALCSAAMAGRVDTLRLLLDHGGNPAAFDGGRSALHVAARASYPQLVQEILDRGVNANLRDSQQRTPLMYAALEHYGRRLERARMRQTERELADPHSGVKLLSGSMAALPSPKKTISVLLAAGADPALIDQDGHTALEIIVQDGRKLDPWLEKTLFAAGSPPIDDWQIRLMKAKTAGEVAELLSTGRDPNFTTARGSSPLTSASRRGNPDIVNLLLNTGADPNRADHDEVPLMAAIAGKSLEVVQLLLDAGANPNAHNPNDENRELPLRFAKSMRYREIVELLTARNAQLDPPIYASVEPGVHWWDDWELIVVKADVATIAAALDPSGKSTDFNPIGKAFVSTGRRTLVLVRPDGLAWTNVLQTSPAWASYDGDTERLAQWLANSCNSSSIYAAYNDTAAAARFRRFEPDGTTSLHDRGNDLDDARRAVDDAKEQGLELPRWAVEMVQLSDNASGDLPTSTERLEALAKAESFALGWCFFHVAPGEKIDVDFPDYPNEALEVVAFVDSPLKLEF